MTDNIMTKEILSKKKYSPWTWIPTLYIAEGLPYFAVNTLTVIMYVNMGVSLADMAFYTGWLYLPWVIKPFWSPFVDLIKTKRSWILVTQLLIAISMALVAFALTTECFFAVSLACFWVMAFMSATQDISADGYYMLALDERQQAGYVGVRSTFYRIASVIGQGGLVMLAGYLEVSLGNIGRAWSIVFIILSLFFLTVRIYHGRILPYPDSDKPAANIKATSILKDFGDAFISFFKKEGCLVAVLFMLLYRLPEALCIKMTQPFLVATNADGGLGLSTTQVGFVNGTVGVVTLLAGGIVGGLAIAKGGLKKWLWPMALSLTLPCAVYCWLAIAQPSELTTISVCIGIEQFGYGFGFSAYMLYMMYFSRGTFQTSHYAISTAFMAMGMMIPGMFAGWLHDKLADNTMSSAMGIDLPAYGFLNFFWIVMLACFATFIATAAVYRTLPDESK